MFSSQTTKSLEEKISILTNKNIQLQTCYNNSLETLGRMALHANMIEKEYMLLREKYESLLEENKLLTECSSCEPVRQRAYEKEYNEPFCEQHTAYQKEYTPVHETAYQKAYNEEFNDNSHTEKRSVYDFAIPLSAIESGYITRQTNAIQSEIENESLGKSTIRRSNRNKK